MVYTLNSVFCGHKDEPKPLSVLNENKYIFYFIVGIR